MPILRVVFLRQVAGGQHEDFGKTVGAESEGMQDRFHIQCHLEPGHLMKGPERPLRLTASHSLGGQIDGVANCVRLRPVYLLHIGSFGYGSTVLP